jgi:hypothetical protein
MNRTRSILELTCAAVCGILAVLTFTVHDWIEVAFGVNPDGGSGMTELVIVVVLASLSVALMGDVLRIHRRQRVRA